MKRIKIPQYDVFPYFIHMYTIVKVENVYSYIEKYLTTRIEQSNV